MREQILASYDVLHPSKTRYHSTISYHKTLYFRFSNIKPTQRNTIVKLYFTTPAGKHSMGDAIARFVTRGKLKLQHSQTVGGSSQASRGRERSRPCRYLYAQEIPAREAGEQAVSLPPPGGCGARARASPPREKGGFRAHPGPEG